MASRKGSADTHPYGGFILGFDNTRTRLIHHKLRAGSKASAPFPMATWSFTERELALLITDDAHHEIGAIVLLERMHRTGGTGMLMARLVHPVFFSPPIAPDELAGIVDILLDGSSVERPNRLDARIWDALLARIQHIRPDTAAALGLLIRERVSNSASIDNERREATLRSERDALGMTFDIAGLKRQELLQSIDGDLAAEARSVLDMVNYDKLRARTAPADTVADHLRREVLHEQDYIRHDQRVFRLLLSGDERVERFTGPNGKEVWIHVYDKKPIETVLGIDLLIYQERYKSLLMLQYKTMDRGSAHKATYLVDDAFREQLSRMAALEAAIAAQPPSTGTSTMQDWRLNAAPCYVKFCNPWNINLSSDQLIEGMTLSAEKVRQFLAAYGADGIRSGQRISPKNCPRYMNNTLFTQLAHDGWIGGDQRCYTLMSDLLHANNEVHGKRTMLAIIKGSNQRL